MTDLRCRICGRPITYPQRFPAGGKKNSSRAPAYICPTDCRPR